MTLSKTLVIKALFRSYQHSLNNKRTSTSKRKKSNDLLLLITQSWHRKVQGLHTHTHTSMCTLSEITNSAVVTEPTQLNTVVSLYTSSEQSTEGNQGNDSIDNHIKKNLKTQE